MDIAVIGGGIGGLTTALLLRKQGHTLTIYEKEEEMGGRLTFHRHGSDRIDQGPTIVLLPQMMTSILNEADVDTQDLTMIPCDPLYDLHFQDGQTFTKWRDLSKQLEEIERCFPGESGHFLSYMSHLSRTFQAGEEVFLNQLFSSHSEFLTFRNLNLLIRSKAYLSSERYVKRFFRDPRLQEAYALQTLYIGGVPDQTPALYSLISFSEHAHGIWYLKGGYASLINKLEQECLTKGIALHKGTEVEEILVHNARVQGVRIGKERLSHDLVIYNGDVPHLPKLLPEEKQVVTGSDQSQHPSTGCLLIYAGVRKRWSTSKMHQFFMSQQFGRHMKALQSEQLPVDPSFYVFNPVALDAEAAAPGESILYFLIPVSPLTHRLSKEAFEPLVDQVLKRAEQQLFPGLTSHLKWLDIRTPREALSDGLFQGGSFGLAPTLRQSGGFRPQITHKKISGLYCVGASVHPGGGVPIVMQGAYLLSKHLEKELSVC